MMSRIAVQMLLVLVPATAALAGSLIVTPPLRPPSGGRLSCLVANGSPTRSVEVRLEINDSNGNSIFGPTDVSIPPTENFSTPGILTLQGHCVVEVTSGPRRSVRAALAALDSASNTVAAVSGQ